MLHWYDFFFLTSFFFKLKSHLQLANYHPCAWLRLLHTTLSHCLPDCQNWACPLPHCPLPWSVRSCDQWECLDLSLSFSEHVEYLVTSLPLCGVTPLFAHVEYHVTPLPLCDITPLFACDVSFHWPTSSSLIWCAHQYQWHTDLAVSSGLWSAHVVESLMLCWDSDQVSAATSLSNDYRLSWHQTYLSLLVLTVNH